MSNTPVLQAIKELSVEIQNLKGEVKEVRENLTVEIRSVEQKLSKEIHDFKEQNSKEHDEVNRNLDALKYIYAEHSMEIAKIKKAL